MRHEFRLEVDQPPLYRSRDDRLVTGLCGGVARFTGFSPRNVRAVFVLATVVSLGVVGAGYLVLSLIVPQEPT